jgi:ABC-type antimicrobial peptide transport system permease subunit
VGETIRDIDRALPTFDVQFMSDVVQESMSRLTFVMIVLVTAAVVALTLATIGLYGVISLIVGLRTREIGIRLALGASPGGVARGVTLQALLLAASGVVTGIAAFLLTAQFLQSRLTGVAPVTSGVVVGVTTLLFAVAVGASWLPARRASAVSPVRALAAE